MKNRTIKRGAGMLLAVPMLLSSYIPVSAAVSVELNGSSIYFDQPPVIQDGRTLVPMRAIFEAMGCEVEWDNDSQMIDVYKDDENIMTMWIDSTSMWTTGNNYIDLDVPPQIVNSRTLVPVRAISESIGAIVNWDARTQTVSIQYTKEVEVTLPYDDDDDSYVDDDIDYEETITDDEQNIEEIDMSSDEDIIIF